MKVSEKSITKQTLLEEGTEFEGSMRSNCPITVSGKLKGDVSAPSLTITESGFVCGQVKVCDLKSQGQIAGEIEADRIELSGHVGDQTTIRASSLQVKLNQNDTQGKLRVTFGNCDLQVGEPVVESITALPQHRSQESGKKEQPQFEPVFTLANGAPEPEREP
jgi:cytoskeletal protein CcmA (bactofilin family)